VEVDHAAALETTDMVLAVGAGAAGGAALRNLEFVDLGATKVTAAGVKELQMTLPKCKILHPSLKCE
jgi:hypothetical protein